MPHVAHDETGASYLSMTVAAFIFDEAGRILLIKENYERRRYGPPGGRIEAGESPQQAVIREAEEEICAKVRVVNLIGIYYFAWEPWLAFVFRCEIEGDQPAVPPTGEIAEVAWFNPQDLPSPTTNLLPLCLPDVLNGACGIARDFFHQE